MSVKYYTHFALNEDSTSDCRREFSGIVEVDKVTEHRFGAAQIAAVLARNFDLQPGELELLDWARLH